MINSKFIVTPVNFLTILMLTFSSLNLKASPQGNPGGNCMKSIVSNITRAAA